MPFAQTLQVEAFEALPNKVKVFDFTPNTLRFNCLC